MIDSTDIQILELLQQDARISNAEIARQVGMAPSATHERLRKLEERGVIQGYTVRLSPERLGLGLLAFIFVRADEGFQSYNAEHQLAALPEVEINEISRWDYYGAAGADDVAVVIATGEARIYANLLLTIGVRQPGE